MKSVAASLRFDDFLTQLQGTANVPDAQRLLQKTVEQLGFKTYDYATGLTTPQPVSALDVAIDCYLSTVGWSDRYITEGFPAHDRFTRTALSRVSPFGYDLLLGRPPETAKQRQMEGEIGEQGIKSGVVIPIHSSSNRYGVVHFGAELKPTEFSRLDRETRPIAALIASYFHEHMMGLLAPAPLRSELSPREAECLRWAALGKTSWEISEILAISERTVKKHVGSAMEKLGVTTRTQAVAKAMARGLIRP